MTAADAMLVASGTAVLEAALHKADCSSHKIIIDLCDCESFD